MQAENLFQRIKKVRVSDAVVDQILSLIEDGTLQIGDQLPSERQLVDQFQVARASVREALRILEFEGVIEVMPGKGTFVIGDGSNQDTNEDVVRQWFKDHASEVLEMLQVREALERQATYLGTLAASPEVIEELRATLDMAETHIDEGNLDKLVQLDRHFHRVLVNASSNKLLADLVDMLVDALLNPRRSLMRLPGRAPLSWQAHRVIFEAVAAGDPDAAEQAMQAHIANVRDAILDLTAEEANG
jgi:DNA-binding FadR family transcriptional regulator